MHLLVTADTVGGVWTYTQELVTGLTLRGHEITLVSFGKLPSSGQTLWMASLPTLDYRPTEFRLEWMEHAERDIAESMEYLRSVVDEIKPDLLHLSQFAYGALQVEVPRIVVAHSDVLSWWLSVHNDVAPSNAWLNWYRDIVANGLRGATVVVAPSKSMLSHLHLNFAAGAQSIVIPNGRDPRLFNPLRPKIDRVVAVGRLWDQAKQVDLLMQHRHAVPLTVVGPRHTDTEPERAGRPATQSHTDVHFTGALTQAELSALLAESTIYAATSCYEPFGLAPLEAALCGCALIVNDIPTFRELWDDAVLFFDYNDAHSLADQIAFLVSHPDVRQTFAERAYRRALDRFTSSRMLDHYEIMYHEIMSVGVRA
jgi:glycogen synthase